MFCNVSCTFWEIISVWQTLNDRDGRSAAHVRAGGRSRDEERASVTSAVLRLRTLKSSDFFLNQAFCCFTATLCLTEDAETALNVKVFDTFQPIVDHFLLLSCPDT